MSNERSLRERNAAAIALLDKWLADESGYDERNWLVIRRAIDGDIGNLPLVYGGRQMIWAAVVVVAAIIGVGLVMVLGFLYSTYSLPQEIPGVGLNALKPAGGLILWMHNGH